MPPLEDMDRTEYAVLWPAGSTGDDGCASVGSPVELMVRWEDTRAEGPGMFVGGQAVTAVVHVNRDVAIGSHMWLGRLTDWYSVGSAGRDNGLCVVIKRLRGRDLKGNFVRYELLLGRYGDGN